MTPNHPGDVAHMHDCITYIPTCIRISLAGKDLMGLIDGDEVQRMQQDDVPLSLEDLSSSFPACGLVALTGLHRTSSRRSKR